MMPIQAATQTNFKNAEKDPVAFYGRDYEESYFPDYIKLPKMREFLIEVLNGVVVVRENKQSVITINPPNSTEAIGPDPLIILDGVPISESSIILNLNPETVKCIRVIRKKYYYKDQVYDGVFDLITYAGDASGFELPGNISRSGFTHVVKGITRIEPEFISGNGDKIPIFKNLLLWNSEFKSDKEGKGAISIVAPDNEGCFRIRCFNLTQAGIAGEGGTIINVGK